VRALLDEQYARLSATEQSVLVWLAILREPVTVQEVLAVLSAPLRRAQVLEAVESLRRRSLIEPGLRQGSFTLHSVVMEYVTVRLIAGVISEIEQGTLSRLTEHGLELASSKDYVRQTQQRLLLAPILAGLRSSYPLRTALEERLFTLLNHLRERADDAQGYVGCRARRVRADAPGAPGNSPIPQSESRWPLARQLRGRWRYHHLGPREWRASAHPAAGSPLRAPQYHGHPGALRSTKGIAARVGSVRRNVS
jgi:hypothetical protein